MPVLPELVVCHRLTLRRWVRDDVAILRTAIEQSAEHLRPWMPFINHEPMSDDDRTALIDGWERDWRRGGDIVYGMFADDTVVGDCTIEGALTRSRSATGFMSIMFVAATPEKLLLA